MNKYLWWHNIFHLFLSHCFMNGSSIVKGRIPFVWSHRWRSFQSHLSFYFLTVPPLCCVPFSPQIAHWPACIYSANATRFVTTATCYNPPPPTPREQLFLYFRHNLQTVRQHTAAKVRCHIVVWAHFKMSEQTGAIIRFHQGLLSSGSAFIYFWQVYCSL